MPKKNSRAIGLPKRMTTRISEEIPPSEVTSDPPATDDEATINMNIPLENAQVFREDDHEQTTDGTLQDDISDGDVRLPAAKRKKKSPPVIISEENERTIARWLEANDYIYDKGNRHYKDKAKVENAWEELGATLNPRLSAKELKTWWYSVRSRYGRLTTTKSGQVTPARRLTGREKWIIDIFRFLKPHIVRQRKTSQIGLEQVIPSYI